MSTMFAALFGLALVAGAATLGIAMRRTQKLREARLKAHLDWVNPERVRGRRVRRAQR